MNKVINVKGELGGRWGSILGRRQGVSGKVDSTTTHPQPVRLAPEGNTSTPK